MADDDTDQDPAATEAESEVETESPPPDPTTTKPEPSTSDIMTGTPPSDLHDDSEYQQQLENQYKTDVFNYNRNYLQQQQYIQSIQRQMQDLANTPRPQMLNQLPPPTQEDKTTVTQNVMQLLAIAGIAFSVFGARRNSYSQGALMGGMGALLQGYAQGRGDRQKDDLVNWHRLNEEVQKENQQRRQEYEDILKNKHLNLTEQMDLMKKKGEFYSSSRMQANAQKSDLAAIHKHLQQMKKAETTHSVNTPKETQDQKRYAALVREKSKIATGQELDVQTPEGADWALHNYPFSQYLNESKSETKYDEKGNLIGSSRGGFSSVPPEKAPKTDLDRAMDQKFGGIKNKAKSSTTTDDQNKSVLEQDTEGTGL